MSFYDADNAKTTSMLISHSSYFWGPNYFLTLQGKIGTRTYFSEQLNNLACYAMPLLTDLKFILGKADVEFVHVP
jgi:hypothetical protein